MIAIDKRIRGSFDSLFSEKSGERFSQSPNFSHNAVGLMQFQRIESIKDERSNCKVIIKHRSIKLYR